MHGAGERMSQEKDTRIEGHQCGDIIYGVVVLLPRAVLSVIAGHTSMSPVQQ